MADLLSALVQYTASGPPGRGRSDLGGGVPQSMAVLHMPEPAHCGKPGWHLPSALQ